MSNRILCTCGKEHAKDQPLVITITTCPKKKHHPLVRTSPKKAVASGWPHLETSSTADAPGDRSQRKHEKSTGNEDLEPQDHLILCEDEGVTIASKNPEMPLIDNSAFCDMDNEPGRSNSSKIKNIPSDREKDTPDKPKSKKETKHGPRTDDDHKIESSNKPKSKKETKHEPRTDDGHKIDPKSKSREVDDGQSKPQSNEANNTFFDPGHPSDSKEEDLLRSTPLVQDTSVDDKKSWVSLPGKPSQVKWMKGSREQGKDAKDQMSNIPSEMQMKLPILIPRYHGPGCTMEVEVLEKHDKNCR